MAFDLPGKDAAWLLEHKALQEAVAKAGMVLDRPQSIALEVQVGLINFEGLGVDCRSGGGGRVKLPSTG